MEPDQPLAPLFFKRRGFAPSVRREPGAQRAPAPKHVTLDQIFAGMMPYMFIVMVCMVLMYIWSGMTLWLPNHPYGG